MFRARLFLNGYSSYRSRRPFGPAGANAGAGYQVSRLLLSKGAELVMLNRNPQKSERAIAALKQDLGPDIKVSFIEMDLARFSVECNKTLLDYNLERSGEHIVDLPDAVATGVALWEDIVIEAKDCNCYTCIHEEEAYGMVILGTGDKLAVTDRYGGKKPNARVCKELDNAVFKERLLSLLMS